MNNIMFTDAAWNEYCYWQTQDKKILKRINQLLKDIQRNSFEGLGKPEPLKNNLSGYWSRRIDDNNRIFYKVTNSQIEIIQCKSHYKSK